MDAAVENLNAKLYGLFMEELDDLSIGYSPNKARMAEMKNIVHELHVLSSNLWTRAYRERVVTDLTVNPYGSAPQNFWPLEPEILYWRDLKDVM